jgi:hypothetical protein
MRSAAVIVAAYLLTSVLYVWNDVRAHLINQPAYAREYTLRGRIFPLILAACGWPLTAILTRQWGSLVLALALFAILVGIGLYYFPAMESGWRGS